MLKMLLEILPYWLAVSTVVALIAGRCIRHSGSAD